MQGGRWLDVLQCLLLPEHGLEFPGDGHEQEIGVYRSRLSALACRRAVFAGLGDHRGSGLLVNTIRSS